ncbi:hypothetical protein BV378_34965 [Nostoc sp. RF31YmG]|nr:hypothetical protein BV378_34965 [Nostoc sp. RF31YmG]OUL19303.1 hypothetical protein BV375_32270 [Nostoc sp. 106C]
MALVKYRKHHLEPNQLNLFPDVKPKPALRAETLVISADALLKWKAQILDYQQRVRESKPPEQVTLFDLAPTHCDPDTMCEHSSKLIRASKYVCHLT